MKATIIKIWKDPVLSKVISVGIIGFISIVYNLISSSLDNSTFRKEFIKFWSIKIELWWIITIALLIWITYYLLNPKKFFKYDDETLKLDRIFFTKIHESYLTEEMMLIPKKNGFSSNPFLGESLHKIFDIFEESKKSNFEFFNPELEQKKNDLINEIQKFYEITSNYIFGTNQTGWLSIPRDWAHNNREQFDKAWKGISKQENILSEKYDDLIKSGRRILKI